MQNYKLFLTNNNWDNKYQSKRIKKLTTEAQNTQSKFKNLLLCDVA